MILAKDAQHRETLRKSKLRSAPSVRRNRIDDCDNVRNPRRKQQRYCYARHPKVRETLRASGLSLSQAAIYGETYDLCGTYLFENRLGSVCAKADLIRHLKSLMPARTVYRHLAKLESIELICMPGVDVASQNMVILNFYTDSNPTKAEAESRHEDRRAQWRQAQARRRARNCATCDTKRSAKSSQLLRLPTPVITQYSNKRCCTQRAGLASNSGRSLHVRFGRRSLTPPPGYFYNPQGHLKVLLSDEDVQQAMLETENELFGIQVNVEKRAKRSPDETLTNASSRVGVGEAELSVTFHSQSFASGVCSKYIPADMRALRNLRTRAGHNEYR